MPYIQLDQQQYPLSVGETSIGTSAAAQIRLPGADALGVQAVVSVTREGEAVVRRADEQGKVRVNGIELGAEPTPLIHGDRLELLGRELRFGDERRGGGTVHMSSSGLESTPRGNGSAARPSAAARGGRLVSLVDGREYQVPERGLQIGRDARCDVVVPSNEVSRQHAQIARGHDGYVLTDTSTNGTIVNGRRVEGAQLLGRGDILRIGGEDFRFYADVPPPEDVGSPALEPRASPAEMPVSAEIPDSGQIPVSAEIPDSGQVPVSGAPAEGGAAAQAAADRAASAAGGEETPLAHPAFPEERRAAGPPVLATLEIINEGLNKGRRFELRQPLAHVGRGDHNDIVVTDESVSDTHARLQRRGAAWFVVDMGSTNGTYVHGRRIQVEQEIPGPCDLRFGGVKMAFRPAADVRPAAKGTRAIAGVSTERGRRIAEVTEQRARAAAENEKAEDRARRLPGWLWILVVVLVGAAILYIWRGL